MTLQRRDLFAFVLGMALLVVLLLLSSINTSPEHATQQMVLENVQLYVPPEPPPPPDEVTRNRKAGGGNDLQIRIPDQPVALELMELNTDAVTVSAPGGYGVGDGSGIGEGMGIGIGDGDGNGVMSDLFTVGQLDSLPMLVSSGQFVYPLEMLRKGIFEFRVLYHIVVDEEGHTTPIRILQGPDPALNERLMKYAETAVFTPPVREGKKVKAQYSWPVTFHASGGP